MNYLSQGVHWFFSGRHYKLQSDWFKRLLYLGVLVKTLGWLLHYNLYFGAGAVFLSRPYALGFIKDPAFLLYNSSLPALAFYFLVPLLLLCLLGLTRPRIYFLPDALIWFLVLNIHNKIYPTLTGGDYLLNQFLLFNCLLSFSFAARRDKMAELRNFFHNLAVVAIITQVCFVYLLSALAKCNDAGWTSGTAIGQLQRVHHFNLYHGLPLASESFLFRAATYLVLFYQLAFPLLVWIKKIKKPFIVLGLLIHLYIAVVMGLTGFGLIMMLAYIFFWPFKTKQRFMDLLQKNPHRE